MRRFTFIRALIVAFTAALTLLPAGVLGAQPERFHSHFTDTFSTEICGIAVEAELVVTETFFFFEDGTFKSTGSFQATFANPLTGKSVIVSSAGMFTGPPPIIDEEAGTITFLASYKGLPEKIQAAGGPVLLRDAGVITFADTFDRETGEFISSDAIIRGPHPEAESDFVLFCDVVSRALT